MKYKYTILILLIMVGVYILTACTNEKNNSLVTSEENEILNPNSISDQTDTKTEQNEDITNVIIENNQNDISSTNPINPIPVQVEDIELGHQKSNNIIYIDLNGDEKAEKIEYTVSGRLLINEIEYDNHLDEFRMDKPLRDYYTILDIDSKDKYLEIGISSYGRSDDLYTLFYYYDKGELIYMGRVVGIPYHEGGESITVVENGVLKTAKEPSLLHSAWWCDEYIDLNEEHELIVREQDFYETKTFTQIYLIQPLTLYSEPDNDSDKFIINEQSVTFIMTDNKNWVKLKGEDGTEGWFYIVSYRYMEDGETLATDIFEGLEYWD